MALPVTHIISLLDATVLKEGAPEQEVQNLVIDSRKINQPEESVFFAIKGEYRDGHAYINDAHQSGIRCFIVSEGDATSDLPAESWVIQVNNTLMALQQLVSAHRAAFNIPVIGITGSNGKTVVKDWLTQLLVEDKKVVKNPKSYNSQVGVPLSVWEMQKNDEVAVFEAGISQPGEMEKLEPIIRPTIGVFTNIGMAHAENFSSTSEKVAEKMKLFAHSQTLIYCADYPEIIEQVDKTSSQKQIAWSWENKGTVFVRKEEEQGVQLLRLSENEKYPVLFRDKASLENIVHCILVMKELGYSQPYISERLKTLQPVTMRLEMKRGRNNCTLINDTYSSDLSSLKIALDTLGQLNQHVHKTLIISDIFQSGMESDVLYKNVAELVVTHKVHRVIGIGKEIKKYARLFDASASFYADTNAFLDALSGLDFKDEAILIKGARAFRFEKITAQLEDKVHQTVLEVNLDAMVHNLNVYRSQLQKDVKLMVMVKAASYGMGGYEVANMLQYYKVDYLAVAYTDEGVMLRKAGITLPIMVMSPETFRYDVMAEYNLEPEIYNFSSLDAYMGFASGKKEVPGIHIKVDTGMRRLGFQPDDVEQVVEKLKQIPSIKVNSVFSHLAASDMPENDAFTNQQVEVFHDFSRQLSEKLGYSPLRHILNSAGIQRFSDAQFDMVRLGVGLYGVGADEAQQTKLQQVVRLKTTISQIKNVEAGDSIGYGRSQFSKEKSQIATVPIGYADGLRRSLSNGKGKMFVKGQPASIVGRVCMDMTMIDVTGLDVEEGDEVIVIGDEYPIMEMAKELGTIPYEVLTGISHRVKRIYIQE